MYNKPSWTCGSNLYTISCIVESCLHTVQKTRENQTKTSSFFDVNVKKKFFWQFADHVRVALQYVRNVLCAL